MSDVRIELFIGCHSTYNDGFLFDKCYEISSIDELDDALIKAEKHFLKSIKKAKPDWEKEGYITDTYCEELYIADSEIYVNGEFVNLDDGECIDKIRDFLESMEHTFNYPIQLLMEIMKNQGAEIEALKEIDDNALIFEIDSESNSDLAYGYLELTGSLENMEGSEFLKQYFDYESYGHDLSVEMQTYNINGTYYGVSNN